MTGWTLFFAVLGVATATGGLFEIIDFIEQEGRYAKRKNTHRW